MKFKDAIELVYSELEKAKKKHEWPIDIVHAAAVVGEEAGELLQAALDQIYDAGNNIENMRIEAAQTAAVAIRFLLHLEK